MLQLLKRRRYDIPTDIECEYRGEGPVAEARKCYRYFQDALACREGRDLPARASNPVILDDQTT